MENHGRGRSNSFTSVLSGASTISQGDGGGSKRRVLVITGGSGWLGSTIARLAYSHWDDLQEIRLFDLKPPESGVISAITGFSPAASKPKVSYYHGSILNEDALLACFTKADAVIHCAALVENGSILLRRHMKTVNVDGTQKVIQSCLECGVRALVFTGSITQVMEANTPQPVRYDESHPPGTKELIFSHYAGSKNEAENLVLLADGKEGKVGVPIRTCSLRCPMMYGEGDSTVIPSVIRAARSCFGYLIPMGLTGNNGITTSSLYVGNGAWGHVVAARKLLDLGGAHCGTNESGGSATSIETTSNTEPDIGGKFYYIGDHTPNCSTSNFMAQFLRPLGYRVLPLGIPFWVMRVLVFFWEFVRIVLAFLRFDVKSGLNRTNLQYSKLSYSLSWDKAKRELDYAPLYSHKTALAQSMEFYRKVS